MDSRFRSGQVKACCSGSSPRIGKKSSPRPGVAVGSRPSHGLYSTAPSTTIITVTHTRVAAARAPDTHASSASCDRGSYDCVCAQNCGRATGRQAGGEEHVERAASRDQGVGLNNKT